LCSIFIYFDHETHEIHGNGKKTQVLRSEVALGRKRSEKLIKGTVPHKKPKSQRVQMQKRVLKDSFSDKRDKLNEKDVRKNGDQLGVFFQSVDQNVDQAKK